MALSVGIGKRGGVHKIQGRPVEAAAPVFNKGPRHIPRIPIYTHLAAEKR